MTEREKFEAFARIKRRNIIRCDDGKGDYANMVSEDLWHVWQAAIAAHTPDPKIEAALAGLPHTTDGVPIVPGMKVWFLTGAAFAIGSCSAQRILQDRRWHDQCGALRGTSSTAYFSTRQAALDQRVKRLTEIAQQAVKDAEAAREEETK